MIIVLIVCNSDFTQLVCGLSAHLSAHGASVCVVVHIACFVVNVECRVDEIAYSLVLYLQFCSTLNKTFFFIR